MATEVANYTKLAVWEKSMELVERVYGVTQAFPKEELYALTNQMRRAAVSIPSNIAEGRSWRTTKEFMRYLNIANGSVAELETQIMLVKRLGYASLEQQDNILGETVQIGRMLNGLYASLMAKALRSGEAAS